MSLFSLDRTYEELKRIPLHVVTRELRQGLDRTYEELKLIGFLHNVNVNDMVWIVPMRN